MTRQRLVPSNRSVSKRWLRERNACLHEYELFGHMFGDGEMAVTRKLVKQALEVGLNVVWAGIRLIDVGGRREFVNFTIDQRGAALERLLGGPPPGTVDEWRRRAEKERATWAALGDYGARSRALACRDVVEDMGAEPTVLAAEVASLHALRAIGMAGLDEAAARRGQTEHLLAIVTGTVTVHA